MKTVSLSLLCLASLSACAHGNAAAVTAAPKASLMPAGCAENLSGSWEHEDSMTFRYEARDDGQTLVLVPHRVNADGSPMPEDARAQDMRITLARRPEGFTGDFRMLETTDQGKTCGVLFEAKITACAGDRLTLAIEQSYAVNESCERVDTGGPDIAEHVLVRRK